VLFPKPSDKTKQCIVHAKRLASLSERRSDLIGWHSEGLATFRIAVFLGDLAAFVLAPNHRREDGVKLTRWDTCFGRGGPGEEDISKVEDESVVTRKLSHDGNGVERAKSGQK
jgi:hypothetical protein